MMTMKTFGMMKEKVAVEKNRGQLQGHLSLIRNNGVAQALGLKSTPSFISFLLEEGAGLAH